MSHTLTLREHPPFLTVSWPIDLKRAEAATWPRKDQWSMAEEGWEGGTECTLRAALDNNRHMSIKTPSDGHRLIMSNLFKYSCLPWLVFPLFFFCIFVPPSQIIQNLFWITQTCSHRHPSSPPPLPNEKCNLPRGKACIREIYLCIYRLPKQFIIL